jgi:LysM repeat protein
VAIGLLVALALLSAGATFAAVRLGGIGGPIQPSGTPSLTPTTSPTSPPTATETPVPSPTPLPPIEYSVVLGDTCLGLAVEFDVSIQSILTANRLGVECLLSVGQTLLIPQPTPTVTPLPSSTLSAAEATDAACDKVTYTVQEADTLSGIAANYNVSPQAIQDYNGMTGETVFTGQLLVIPLCARNPTPGPTPTSTAPPPYPAASLLLPADGSAYDLSHDSVTLQWASVGQLRENEVYQVMVVDVTEGTGRRQIIEYVNDTKLIVPASFRPEGPVPHVMRWWVTAYRQVGTNTIGQPIYQPAGAPSVRRDFTWSGAAVVPTATPG